MPDKFNSDLISIIFTFFVFLLLIFFTVITFALRYRKRKKEHEKMRVQFSEQLLKSQLEIQEQTLQHVSRELHDNIGQIASLIKINLNTIQLQKPETAESKLENTRELTRQMITDIKLLSTSLNGDKMTKIGLAKALQNEVEKINKTGVFTAELQQTNSLPALQPEKAIIVYRMVQEVLNNALKHAEATHIYMEAGFEKNTFTLLIKDNGKGFDVAQKLADDDAGNGLLNLQQRAKVINADIQFRSAPGTGTVVTIFMNL